MSHDSLSPEALRMRINGYAPYMGAGIEVTHLAEDFGELRVQMRLTGQNRNLVGTHFGGSLYAMVDPHHMILLMRRLGPGYTVWDKSAAIEFVKPGRGTVQATIRVTDDDVAAIRAATASGQKHYPQWTVDVMDQEGDIVARVVKTLFVQENDPTA